MNLTAGAVLDHLSEMKGVLFNCIPIDAKELYQGPSITHQTIVVPLYTDLPWENKRNKHRLEKMT